MRLVFFSLFEEGGIDYRMCVVLKLVGGFMYIFRFNFVIFGGGCRVFVWLWFFYWGYYEIGSDFCDLCWVIVWEFEMCVNREDGGVGVLSSSL